VTNKNTDNPLDRPLAALSVEDQASFKIEAKKFQDIMFSRTMDFGFELIKHFVTINAAGVAGATAIASASAKKAELAVPYFFAGMIVAICVMILVYINGIQITSGMMKKYQAILYRGAPVGTFKFSIMMWACIWITWVCGGISIILFIVGAAMLIWTT